MHHVPTRTNSWNIILYILYLGGTWSYAESLISPVELQTLLGCPALWEELESGPNDYIEKLVLSKKVIAYWPNDNWPSNMKKSSEMDIEEGLKYEQIIVWENLIHQKDIAWEEEKEDATQELFGWWLRWKSSLKKKVLQTLVKKVSEQPNKSKASLTFWWWNLLY